jgi:hypothetical protein
MKTCAAGHVSRSRLKEKHRSKLHTRIDTVGISGSSNLDHCTAFLLLAPKLVWARGTDQSAI